jgi:hypothetical protein
MKEVIVMNKIVKVQTEFENGRITIDKMDLAEYAIYKERMLRNDNVIDVKIKKD